MKKAKVILLDISWKTRYGRQVRRGIYHFAHPRKPWVFVNIADYDSSNQRLKHPAAAGLISMRDPRDYAGVVRRKHLAAVGIGCRPGKGEFTDLPYVGIDPKAIGEMAADYFIKRGFRNFGVISAHDPCSAAYFSYRATGYFSYRDEAFIAALKRRKLSCDVFDPQKDYPRRGEPLPTLAGNAERTRRWLESLPRPSAVFAIEDIVGLWVCETCWWADIHVPEEIAVLGVGDDGTFCGMANPHLSSITVPAEQVGFEAAKLLDAMLRGRKAPKRPILLPPMGVITRQSTDIMAIEDSYVTRAVRFIREHACEGIRVEDVMAEVRLPRRTLEQRFRKALNRSPFSEIRRVQIEHIKMLLAQTDMTLEALSPECGFADVARMSLAFKKATGFSPGAWRKQFRNR